MLEDRFGISPSVFARYTFFQTTHKYISIVSGDHVPPVSPDPASTGMVFIRTNIAYPKLTTGAAMAFGYAANRNVIDLTREQALFFYSRKSFPVDDEQTEKCSGMGYVLPKYREIVLGVGLYQTSETGGMLHSLFPKSRAIRAYAVRTDEP